VHPRITSIGEGRKVVVFCQTTRAVILFGELSEFIGFLTRTDSCEQARERCQDAHQRRGFSRNKEKMDAREKMIIVDVREDNEWARGHIPGAVHLGKGVIERNIEKAIPDEETPLVPYCGGGFRSALAADNLQKMGYRNVTSMDGGWRGWTESGFPTIKD
jgi:rhodanese-related sulfurtransferase